VTIRLFVGNFDFEHRLAEPARETPARLRRLNAELATSWLSIAQDGDWIWTPEKIDESFFCESARYGFPHVTPVTSFSDVPRNVQCVPWGWSAEMRTLTERHGWDSRAPSDSAVRFGNSRATSHQLEQSWGVGLKNARRVESLEQLQSAIRSLGHSTARWVVKAEFGMSARERILGRGGMTTADENWVRRRLAGGGVVFFEPWVERIGEVGIQIDVLESEEPRLIGLAPMLVDDRGQYAGSWFAFDKSRFARQQSCWPSAIDCALNAAKHLQAEGYFGPLGIDAMIYRDEDGTERIRPLQDINARWTMGRLGLGWHRFARSGEEGCWQHGSAGQITVPPEFTPTRIIPTSPEIVGDSPCFHSSRLLIR
jgi:hypothetical protein